MLIDVSSLKFNLRNATPVDGTPNKFSELLPEVIELPDESNISDVHDYIVRRTSLVYNDNVTVRMNTTPDDIYLVPTNSGTMKLVPGTYKGAEYFESVKPTESLTIRIELTYGLNELLNWSVFSAKVILTKSDVTKIHYLSNRDLNELIDKDIRRLVYDFGVSGYDRIPTTILIDVYSPEKTELKPYVESFEKYINDEFIINELTHDYIRDFYDTIRTYTKGTFPYANEVVVNMDKFTMGPPRVIEYDEASDIGSELYKSECDNTLDITEVISNNNIDN